MWISLFLIEQGFGFLVLVCFCRRAVFWTEQYFKRDNYLKIDNKQVLFVFIRRLSRDSVSVLNNV